MHLLSCISFCLEIRYVTVSYHDTTAIALFIYSCTTSFFYQHGICDTTYDTFIMVSLKCTEPARTPMVNISLYEQLLTLIRIYLDIRV